MTETGLRNERHLSMHDLVARINDGDIDTVVVAFTDMQGRLQGKRLHGRYFADIVVDHGTEGCNYLLAVDVDMNTVGGYSISSWERGYGDMEFVLDERTIRLLTHLPATAMVQCDLVWLDHSPVVQSPRTILQTQLDRCAEQGWAALAGTELEFIAFDTTYEAASRRGVPRPHPGQPVQRRLLDPRHQPGRAAAAGDPQHDVRRRAGRRGRQGRVQLRPARDRLPLRRRAHHRRQPRRLQDRGQGDRRPAGQVDHLHGEVQRARGQLLPHPPLAARHRRVAGVLGRGHEGTDAALRPLRRGRAGHGRRLHAALRAEHQLLQAVRGRLVRADHDRVGPRQPHLRGAAGRSRRRRADGEPGARRRREPLPRASPRCWPAACTGSSRSCALGDELVGNAYESDQPQVPHTMAEARERFASSDLARAAFGDEVVDHYTNMADVELAAYDAAVTDWELRQRIRATCEHHLHRRQPGHRAAGGRRTAHRPGRHRRRDRRVARGVRSPGATSVRASGPRCCDGSPRSWTRTSTSWPSSRSATPGTPGATRAGRPATSATA